MNFKRKLSENATWYSVICAASIVVLFILLAPPAFAQGRDTETRQYTDLLRNVLNFIDQNYVDDIDPRILYEGAMKGMLDAVGDPYTSYLDTKGQNAMMEITRGSFGGVGLTITKRNESTPENPAYVEVSSPMEDTPGWKAGIQSGDMIISINGISTPEISMDEVLGMLRGPVGEKVELVIRRGKNLEFPVSIERALIEVPTVKYGMIDSTIGYLRIIEFTAFTEERVQEALDFFKDKGYTGLIIDLRNNPGGLIDSVVAVADKFIDSGTIVSTKSRIPYQNITYTAQSKKTMVPKGLPIAVLINQGSASASEILAGALKDYHQAYLVGETTYGKGSVQQVMDFKSTGDGIKLTMARYYTPSDSNIDKTGIPPDREISFPMLTETEEKAFTALAETTTIADFVAKHPDMTAAEITAFADQLYKTYPMQKRFLKRLITLEQYRSKEVPLYDLDYDIQLQEAVSIIQNENFSELMKSTKTIKELQEEAAAEPAAVR